MSSSVTFVDGVTKTNVKYKIQVCVKSNKNNPVVAYTLGV